MHRVTTTLLLSGLLACTLGPKTHADDTASLGTTSGADTATTVTPTSDTSTTSGPTSGTSPGTTAIPGSTHAEDETFIALPDFGPLLPSCDLAAQVCPEGEKCNPSGIGGCGHPFCSVPLCVPVVPDAKPPGAPCSVLDDASDGTDDCELGSVCLFHEEDGIGTCHQICNAHYTEQPKCTKPGDLCFMPGCQECFWGYCNAPCDPREPDACDPGEVCIGFESQLECYVDASGETGQAGDPCEFFNACDPGLLCMNAAAVVGCDGGSNGCCSPFCSTDQPIACPGKAQGELCVPWFTEDESPPELATLGICSLPP